MSERDGTGIVDEEIHDRDQQETTADRKSELLKQKRLLKTCFTKAKSYLTSLLCSETANLEQLKSGVDQVLKTQEDVINVLLSLCELDPDRYDDELDAIQDDPRFTETVFSTLALIKSKSSEIDTARQSSSNNPSLREESPQNSSVTENDHPTPDNIQQSPSNSITAQSRVPYSIDSDMHNQLKRVSIPRFDGNKRDYPLFKDAFEHCIDRVACSDGYKMLQLRQYLHGDALRAIEGFSASSLGYASAKKRLEEKYGGHRRTVLLHLDYIRQMRPINSSDLQMLEEFTDKLELSIVALKDAGRVEEFEENSMFYSVAKSKLSPMNITNFKRWVYIEKKTENLVNLHAWLALEVKFRIEALEEVGGFYAPKTSPNQGGTDNAYKKNRAYTTNYNSRPKCDLCTNNHRLVDCPDFRSLSVDRRWQVAKDKSLCFRCLSPSHEGRYCKNSRRCGIDNCPRSHHTLLLGGGYPVGPPLVESEGNRRWPRTNMTTSGDHVGMRIIPVIVNTRHRTLQLNALLDECSTDSYISESVASELGLKGPVSDLNISVLGGKRDCSKSCKVNFIITSLDGQTSLNLDAFTIANVTDGLQMIDWNKYAHNWPHLRDIDFPRVSGRVHVDLLLGLNVSDVHRSLVEISGRPGEPIARLTPLGWTCIGPLFELNSYRQSSNHFARTFFVHDDTNTLLRNTPDSRKYKPFVSNRVGEIHSLSEPSQWHYGDTKSNASDPATRGLSASALSNCDLWWQRPLFLSQSSENWPLANKTSSNPSEDALLEIRLVQKSILVATPPRDLGRLEPSRYSSWIKLLRITSWIFRFIKNIRVSPQDRCFQEYLTTNELSASKTFWHKVAQKDCFASELHSIRSNKQVDSRSPLASLNPCLDEDGVFRLDGRLRQADHISYESRFPVILPRSHDVTRLIATHIHNEGNHDLGTSHCISKIREEYWILRLRQVIKSVEHHCNECRRRKCKPAKQLMAPLPLCRIGTPSHAFSEVGVDFAGPFVTKQGRGKVRTKRYLCLFTCLSSRAVHLDMAWGLDSHSFLLAFDRFVNRRGKPNFVLSDNGTNFVGANRELRNLYKLDNSTIGSDLATKGIEWRFNPPAAPHFGGVFEALIKSAKRAIKAVLGDADANDEELMTVFIHAEGLLNSRPLCYQGDDPKDESVLTPNHFFCRTGDQLVSSKLIDGARFNPRNRWRMVQNLVSSFWKRWLRGFLPTLNNRSKWQTPYKDLLEGDLVLVVDSFSPRG